MRSVKVFILALRYNSQCIDLSEWVSLWTICLAPLLAHIVAGAPPTSLLSRNRPKWHDSLCHYNPTSIIWRYAAITDRRIRATRWSRNDIAATNAVFWTAKGWNGSEDIVHKARPHCKRLPAHVRVRMISVSVLKTIITSLQGVSALYTLIGTLAGQESLAMAVDTVFFPLAVLGLMRLCAAAWLIEDFEYGLQGDGQSQEIQQDIRNPGSKIDPLQFAESTGNFDPFLITPFQPGSSFVAPQFSWKSYLFRTLYLIIIGGMWATSLLFFMPGVLEGDNGYTVTTFLVGLFYFFFLTISLMLYLFYFLRSQTTTTLIPCISTTWYKLYTIVIMGFMLVLVVIASIETNRNPLGMYSTIPVLKGLECRYRKRWLPFHLDLELFGFTPFFGIASELPIIRTVSEGNITGFPVTGVSRGNTSLKHDLWMYNLTGFCVGHFGAGYGF